MFLPVPTYFEEYIVPNSDSYTPFVIYAPVYAVPGAPEVPSTTITARRLRLQKTDFERFGYTAGCSGCVHQQRGLPPRNHSEACRQRVEDAVTQDNEGKERKERVEARLHDQLTRELEREDELLQKQAADATATDAATEGESHSKGENERVQKLPGFTRPRLDDNGPVLQGELCC